MKALALLKPPKRLAEKGNIPLDVEINQESSVPQMPVESKQIIEAHDLLKKFYHHLLVNTKEGQDALEYLLQRGFTEESIEKFQIGYSLDSWDFVYKFLTKRDMSRSF